jgi:hypothetical protein
MKKSLLLKKISVFFILLIALGQFAYGQAILVEEFDYPNGALLTSNGWVASSGGGTQPIDVIVPGLTFTGYPSSGIGGAAQVDNNGEDDKKVFTAQTSGSVYVAALMKVNSTADGYFFNLIGTDSFFRAKIFLSTGKFGITLGANSGSVTSTESAYVIGTTYLVVLKYQIIDGTLNDAVSLYMFSGSIPATEPGTPTIGPVTDAANSDISPTAVHLRQYSATQNITVDGIRVATTWTDAISDVYPPIATFVPANSATDVALNVAPTITFNELVRKTDGNALENSDLATLITFKKTNSGGDNVPFTATIDASKKVITVTPSSQLDNSQLYYLAVGTIEDASGNDFTGANITFTTIAAATPAVALTYPVGGETYYAGDATIFTWTSANVTNVKIEAWVVGNDRTWKWETMVESTPAAAGSLNFTVPANALYGTQYQIRISDASNVAVNSTSGSFTCIAVATSITDLRARCIVNDIVKLSSEATATFVRTVAGSRNQKYIQDANSGLLIDDPSAVLTTVVAAGDNIKNLEGKLGLYGGVLQIVPTKSSVLIASSGNTVTIPEMTLTEYNTNFASYESRLIKLTDAIFPVADGSLAFAASTNYDLTDGATTIKFRTFLSGETSDFNIVTSIIPIVHLKMTCIGAFYNSTIQVYSRTTNDFEFLTVGMEKLSSADKIRMYPVPASSVLNISNVPNLRSIEILDVAGKVIQTINTSSDELIQVPVAKLRRGMYMIRFNTTEGKVVKRFVKS